LIDWETRWPHFKPEEVLSPNGLTALNSRKDLLVRPHALDFLESFRNELLKPIWVNHGGHHRRGYRSCFENQIVGGANNSLHVQGVAFDVTIPGMTPSEVFEKAKAFGWKGLGLYSTFVHMDLRARLDDGIVTWEG
jgi:hypothetical protein